MSSPLLLERSSTKGNKLCELCTACATLCNLIQYYLTPSSHCCNLYSSKLKFGHINIFRQHHATVCLYLYDLNKLSISCSTSEWQRFFQTRHKCPSTIWDSLQTDGCAPRPTFKRWFLLLHLAVRTRKKTPQIYSSVSSQTSAKHFKVVVCMAKEIAVARKLTNRFMKL